MQTALPKEKIDFYNANGYLVLNEVFIPEECDRILYFCRAHADESFRAIMHIERKVPEIWGVIKDPRIVGVIEALHKSEMCSLGSQVLFKEAGSPYQEQSWRLHQDNAYIKARYGTYISAIIPLLDSDPDNGGMFIYPGSHMEDILSYHKHESFVASVNPGYELKMPEKYQKLDLILPQGSLYIQHGNLIHGSYPNNSKTRSRPHFGIMYAVKGEYFDPGNPKYPRIAAALR